MREGGCKGVDVITVSFIFYIFQANFSVRQFEEIVWPSYCSTLSRARLLADNSHNKNCLLFYQSADEFSNQLMEEIILRVN